MGRPTAVDLFCGCGGLTLGLKRAGFSVIAGIDSEKLACSTYRMNHPRTLLLEGDIRRVDPAKLRRRLRLKRSELSLLAGCPPCQGFSTLRTLNGNRCIEDSLNDLIFEFERFIREFMPRTIMLENVPGLTKDECLRKFCNILRTLGYSYEVGILDAADYGVPQRRRRMILIGSRDVRIAIGNRSRQRKTVRNAIGELPPPSLSSDPAHNYQVDRAPHVLRLIRNIPADGGSRTELPARHRLPCHSRCDGFKDVYGRMSWSKPSPTITGGCINPSKGRFLHPEQDRAITLREAALLQGFPRDYKFDLSIGRFGIGFVSVFSAGPTALVQDRCGRCGAPAFSGESQQTQTVRQCAQRTVSKKHPTAVVLLDLGAEQLIKQALDEYPVGVVSTAEGPARDALKQTESVRRCSPAHALRDQAALLAQNVELRLELTELALWDSTFLRLYPFLPQHFDLLNERRIVVWYDGEKDFKGFAAAFNAPNCEVFSAEASVLKTRRRADEVYMLMNESEIPTERDRCLLIYIPRRRGATEDEKMRDPFEVYAMAGAAFGDTEDQKIESLARQAMPQKAEDVTRLFREGRPDIALLDGLEKAQRWPLLNEVFRTETAADVMALALCDAAKSKEVDEKPGCIEELLRLFESVVGFKPASEARNWKTLRSKAAGHVLFSEFIFDLPEGEPDSLSAVPRANDDAKSVVYAACERMRGDSGLCETYTELAQKIESDLRLPDFMSRDFNPGERDTFPFEERRLLDRSVELIVAGDIAAARSVFEDRKRSIWRRDPQRSPAWTALERAVALLESSAVVSRGLGDKNDLAGLVKAYTEGGWSNLDRTSRLFETALTACTDEEALPPVVELCRRSYRESATKMQDAFLAEVKAAGWPPDGAPRQTRVFDDHVAPLLERREKTAFFMVDSLRYEMGCDLGEVFAGEGEVQVRHAAGVLPTVTITGMAALMPGADGILRLVEKDGGLVPALGARLLKTSADRMKLLTETYGDRFFEATLDDLLGAPRKVAARLNHVELLVVRTQDPDSIGENLGSWRARKYLSEVVGDIAAAIRWVVAQGFSHVVVSSDHGHMMLPEIPPGDVVQSPPGGWLENKRRCRLGSGLSGTTGTITLKACHVGIQGDLQEVCLPIGFRVFSDGPSYFHGGMSLQEVVIPVIIYRAGQEAPAAGGKPEIDIRYRSDKFTSRVIGLKFHLQGDMFSTPARVRIEAYGGTGAKAKVVGEAADCEARDEKTHEVTLPTNKESPVPVLLDPDFEGTEIEIRVSDPRTRVVWARRKLKNAMLE